MVMVTEQCECTQCHYTTSLKLVKMVNSMLCVNFITIQERKGETREIDTETQRHKQRGERERQREERDGGRKKNRRKEVERGRQNE